jgi:LacI family gluconate utilization system Gnt-I transcriptional repressor
MLIAPHLIARRPALPHNTRPKHDQGTKAMVSNDARGPSQAKITDVAALAGVAPMTVSRVINTPDRVSAQTTARVRAAIEQLGYVPNLIAGGLSSRRSRMVAAIVPTIAHPMFAGLVQSFADGMREAGYQVMLSLSGYDQDGDEALVRTLLSRRPDAMLITGAAYTPAAWQMLTEANIPIVEVWERTTRPIDMLIGFDHAELGATVADYFLAQGHGRFTAFTAGDSRALTRSRGFTDRARQKGATVIPATVVPAPSTITAGREALRNMLPRLTSRTAVFCSSDTLAFGVLTEARVHGVPVPELLSICGFGNFELSAACEPPFTTVNVEGVTTGRRAAEMLLRRLINERGPPRDREPVPYSIVTRATG